MAWLKKGTQGVSRWGFPAEKRLKKDIAKLEMMPEGAARQAPNPDLWAGSETWEKPSLSCMALTAPRGSLLSGQLILPESLPGWLLLLPAATDFLLRLAGRITGLQ